MLDVYSSDDNPIEDVLCVLQAYLVHPWPADTERQPKRESVHYKRPQGYHTDELKIQRGRQWVVPRGSKDP